MIIHFDETISAQCMDSFEELALSLARTSMHTAQQLSYIFIAAIEDYQPENANGEKNPQFNLNRYLRCAKLLKLIEQIVVFRKVSTYNESSKPNTTGTTATNTPNSLPTSPTRTNASIANDDNSDQRKSGFLLYKRVKRKNNFSTKPWKRRFFSVKHRVLLCYRNADDREPLRSILLSDCVLVPNPPESKYNYAFTLYNKISYIKFQLRAADEDSFNSWIHFIKQ